MRKTRKARKNSTAAQAQAAKAMRLWRSGSASSLKAAWQIGKGGGSGRAKVKLPARRSARRNYDTTTVRSSLVPWSGPYTRDLTEVFSALEPYSQSNPRKRKAAKRRSARNNPAKAAQAQAKKAMHLYHSGKASSLKAAWQMVKARHNPDSEDGNYLLRHELFPFHHPVYEQFDGQFSTDEAWTHGIQPMNRRNPRRNPRKKRTSRR